MASQLKGQQLLTGWCCIDTGGKHLGCFILWLYTLHPRCHSTGIGEWAIIGSTDGTRVGEHIRHFTCQRAWLWSKCKWCITAEVRAWVYNYILHHSFKMIASSSPNSCFCSCTCLQIFIYFWSSVCVCVWVTAAALLPWWRLNSKPRLLL